MDYKDKPAPGIMMINKYLPMAEKILLAILLLGIMLYLLKIDTLILKGVILGLAITFFLYVYRRIEIPFDENNKGGFTDLLAYSVVPNVMWLSTSVSTLGILLYLLGLGSDGYKSLLMIGSSTTAVTFLLFGFFLVSGVKHIMKVIPILYRSIPVFILAIIILFNLMIV